MRTTITLDDQVFRAYKTRAAQNGTTFAREVEAALRAELHRHEPTEAAAPFDFPIVHGTLHAGVDYTSNAELADLLEEPDPDRRR